MFCPNCGTQIPDGSAFCQNCGARLTAAQPVQQPQYQQPQQAPYQPQPQVQPPQPQPKKKGSIVKIAVICAAVAVLLGVGRALLSSWLDDGDPVVYRPNQRIESVELVPSSGSGSSSGGGSSSGSGSAASGGGVSSGSTAPHGAQIAASYSTEALPSEADFSWFYDEYLQGIGGDPDTGLPRGAEPFIDATLLDGGWKTTIYRRSGDGDVYRKEFQHFTITTNGNAVEADVAWSGYIDSSENGGAWVSAAGASPDHYSGEWELIDGTLHLSMTDYYDISIDLFDFYTKDGKQYALGMYANPRDDVMLFGFAAFCRP